MPRELGDFQTPSELVRSILRLLAPVGSRWPRVLEPTCGTGNFVIELLRADPPPTEIVGVELQEKHVTTARKATRQAGQTKVRIMQGDLFTLPLKQLRWSCDGPLLIVGNLPWATNAMLGSMGSNNVPLKRNFKGLRGIEALTGDSNFDIAEYMWLKLLADLMDDAPTVALLCKTAVARNVLKHAASVGLPVSEASIYRIDAKKWFGVNADACLFKVKVDERGPVFEADVYEGLEESTPSVRIGVVKQQLVSNIAAYETVGYADGTCPLVWRQGVKHDAASVMELQGGPEGFLTSAGQLVELEPGFVFPLLKSSDLYHGKVAEPKRWVIVTQRRLAEDTSQLAREAPRLWAYLVRNAASLDQRKSSIYRGRPRFAMFGIGDYTFSLYKVAVSGLYKRPVFRAVGPILGRPVVLDDTCYFGVLTSAEEAAVVSALLNSNEALSLLNSLVFWDAKRPFTKKVLQRVDLGVLAKRVDSQDLVDRARSEFRRMGGGEGQSVNWVDLLERTLSQLSHATPGLGSSTTGGSKHQGVLPGMFAPSV